MYLFLKRVFDIFLSSFLLLLLLPLFIPIILLLKFSGEGEVFYFQKRIGYKNNRFYIWKFATMLKNSINMGTKSITLRNDPRVTKVGKYLRITKINELPQLFNVFLDNMSFVGPRPLVDETFLSYSKIIQNCIYNSKPGITGIGSIIFRDEEKIISASGLDPKECYNNIIAPYKGELEIWYQRKKSFGTDMIILFLTFWIVLFPDSSLPYKLFKDLPPRPENMKNMETKIIKESFAVEN